MLLPALSLFVVSLGYGVIVPLLPSLSGGVAQVTPGTVSAVYASYAAAKIVAQVPGGVWVDRRGGGPVLRVALPLFAVSLAGFLWNGGAWWFALVRAVEGAATGLVYPAVFALVLEQGEASGRRIGLTLGIGTSGLLIGPALGWWLSKTSLQLPVVVAAVTALGLSVLVRAPSRPVVGPQRTLESEWRSLSALAMSGGFLGLMLPVAFNKLTFSAFQGLIPLYGPTHLGLDLGGVTALFVLTGVVFGIFQGVGGVLADQLAPRGLVLACSLPLLAAYAALSVVSTGLGFALCYGSAIALSSVIFTATLKHAARAFGTQDTYGGVFGVLGTLTDTMTVVGPLLFLNVYGAVEGWVFAVMALIGVPSVIGYAGLSRSRGSLPP